MRVTYDPEKRERTLKERGLDFEDAKFVFSGATLEVEDTRKEWDTWRKPPPEGVLCSDDEKKVWRMGEATLLVRYQGKFSTVPVTVSPGMKRPDRINRASG